MRNFISLGLFLPMFQSPPLLLVQTVRRLPTSVYGYGAGVPRLRTLAAVEDVFALVPALPVVASLEGIQIQTSEITSTPLGGLVGASVKPPTSLSSLLTLLRLND